MRYLDFLRRFHERLQPPTYLEIGVRHGDSLALATAPAVGIDPAPRLKVELPASVTLFEESSDEHFARPAPLAPFGGAPAGLAFIDGMHLVEFALRDFMHVERHAAWTSVAVFDDLYPRRAEEAARTRSTRAWTGDVFKVARVLERHRPDLVCVRVDTRPTGLLLVLGLDPRSRVLHDRYLDVVRDAVRPDPQEVPAAVLERRGAADPEAVLAAGVWDELRTARETGVPREAGLERLRQALPRPPAPGGRLVALRRRLAHA